MWPLIGIERTLCRVLSVNHVLCGHMTTSPLPVPSHLDLLCPPERWEQERQNPLDKRGHRSGLERAELRPHTEAGLPPGQCPGPFPKAQGCCWATEACAFCLCPPPQLSFQRKVGILYCRAGQGSEEEMYNNQDAGPSFMQFLTLLGDVVRLKGFESYRAQLDTKSEAQGARGGGRPMLRGRLPW